MKCKIFLSDEGFGHLVRQKAIYDQFQILEPAFNATVQTGSHADVARDMFGSAVLIKKFNNIHWARQENGSPDLEKINHFFQDYEERAQDFIQLEQNRINEYDFVISDFVYEAFPVAQSNQIPAFGVAHFTWDWFFSKMYPVPISYRLIEQMQKHAQLADTVFFPPFTPEEILNFFGSKAVQVPLIARAPKPTSIKPSKEKFNVLIMDSGASVLSQHINKAITQINSIDSIHFFIAKKYGLHGENITVIPDGEFFTDYISQVDLVITRGGFNTISECIAYRTPVLLLGETSNPEIDKNLLAIKSEHLGSFISLEKFVNDLQSNLYSFIDHEYDQIKATMNEHDYRTDGATVIAGTILDRIN